MGDGATNQGPFYESLNLAALWELPVVYVIENNGYSMGTAEGRHSAGEPLARRGESFDISWKVAHGHNLYEVRSVIKEAEILLTLKVSLLYWRSLHIATGGHSVADPDQTYRSKEKSRSTKKIKTQLISLRTSL